MKKVFRYCLTVLIILSILLPMNVFAENEISEPYLFMKDFIMVTGFIHQSAKRLEQDVKNTNESDAMKEAMQMMIGLRTASSDIDKAKSYLKRYVDSKDKIINEVSQNMLQLLGLLSKNYMDSLSYVEAISSPEMTKNADPGKLMNELSKLVVDRDNLFSMAMYTSVMATYALLGEPGEDGLMKYLSITSKERDDLKKELEDLLGEDIAGGLQAGQSLSISPISVLYEFLKGDHIPADKRNE